MKHEDAHGFESKKIKKKNCIQLKDQFILFDFGTTFMLGSMNNKKKILF